MNSTNSTLFYVSFWLHRAKYHTIIAQTVSTTKRFSFAGPRVWNSLPSTLWQLTADSEQFKQQVKTLSKTAAHLWLFIFWCAVYKFIYLLMAHHSSSTQTLATVSAFTHRQRWSSHCSVWMFINMVRLALVTSVTYLPPSGPPVKFYTTATGTGTMTMMILQFHTFVSQVVSFFLSEMHEENFKHCFTLVQCSTSTIGV